MTNIFFAGYFSSDRPLESIANYATKVVEQNTINQKYCGLTVQSTEESGPLVDSYSEFHNLYGLFKQTKVTFASAINIYNPTLKDKDHDIRIRAGDYLSDNLSMFYLGPVGSVEYDGHFKHYVYPLETMFADDHSKYDTVPNKYVAYISQSHADYILEYYGEKRESNGKYSKSQYESLLVNADRNVLNLNFDSEKFEFAILNIYFQSNYYYEGVSEMLDDFIAISYYAPLDLRKEQKNIYFLSNYSYQNEYFMKYINNVYSSGKYNIEINQNNIIGSIDEHLLTSFYYENLKNKYIWVVVLLITFSYSLISFGLFITFKNKYNESAMYNVLTLLLCLTPYIVFKLIYQSTYSVGFFTFFSCKSFFITYSLIGIVLVGQSFIKSIISKIYNLPEENYCEVNI